MEHKKPTNCLSDLCMEGIHMVYRKFSDLPLPNIGFIIKQQCLPSPCAPCGFSCCSLYSHSGKSYTHMSF